MIASQGDWMAFPAKIAISIVAAAFLSLPCSSQRVIEVKSVLLEQLLS